MIKTIKKNKLLKNKFFEVENNEVIFNKNKKGEHLLIKPTSKEGVAVLPITEDGYVIIQDEYRYGYGKYITQVVKGGLKEGQTPLEAASEELEEELSLSFSEIIELGCFVEHPSIVKQKGYAFLALRCKEKKDSLEAEETEVFSNKRKILFKDLVEKVINNELDCAVTQMLVLKAAVYLEKERKNI